MDTDKKAPTPPYVAYKTLKNFLEKYKQGLLPSRIDRDLMGTMSGAVQSQVTTALKYLRFISDNSVTTDKMRRYVVAEGEERKGLLKQTLLEAYPFIFADGFDLGTATGSHLREVFEANTSANGETVNRCIAFFKDAAQDAGITVSPYITQRKARGTGTRKRNTAPKQTIAPLTEKNSPEHPNLRFHDKPMRAPIAAQNSLLLWGLFERLPEPGSVWPREQREQWTQTLNNVLALEYKDQ
jgi:hypothetical protein